MDPLRTYPTFVTPETWPINDACLSAMKRLEAKWAYKGYTWRFGQEIEFGLFTPEDIAARLKTEHVTADEAVILSPYAGPAYALHKRLLATPYNPKVTQQLIGRIIERVRSSAAIARFAKTLHLTRDDMLAVLEGYSRDVANDEVNIAVFARKNAYLAWLNLMPAAQGGLFDVIEPRFGSNSNGIGWWDGYAVAEVRTRVSKPFEVIRRVHKILPTILNMAEQFHLVPELDNGGAHLHFSLTHKQSGRNVMRMLTEEDIELAKRMAIGIGTTLSDAPHLLTDIDQKNQAFNVPFSIGIDKKNVLINQKEQSWELIRGYKSNYVHLARDCAVLMGAAYHGAFDIKNHAATKKTHSIEIMEREIPIVRRRYGGLFVNHIQALLYRAYIGKDGAFGIQRKVVADSISDLRLNIGFLHCNVFTHVPKGHTKPKGLGYIDTWLALFKTIRIDENNILQTSHLHPVLQAEFDTIEVTGRRQILIGRGRSAYASLASGLEDKHATLVQSGALRTIFGRAARGQVIAHFAKAYDPLYERKGAMMALRQLQSFRRYAADDTEEEPNNASDIDLIKILACHELILPTLLEMRASIDPHNDHDLPVSIEGFRARKSSVDRVLPHFRRAVQGHINLMRAEVAPSNRLLSLMGELDNFLEQDVKNPNYYSQDIVLIIQEGVVGMLNKQYSISDVNFVIRHTVSTWGNLAIQLALSDPNFKHDDAEAYMHSVVKHMNDYLDQSIVLNTKEIKKIRESGAKQRYIDEVDKFVTDAAYDKHIAYNEQFYKYVIRAMRQLRAQMPKAMDLTQKLLDRIYTDKESGQVLAPPSL